MSEPSAAGPSPIERELTYYKRQVDTLAGENLKLDYVISGLRREVKQKRQGYALLSHLHDSIALHKEISAIFSSALPAINATVAMDRTVVLTPAGDTEGLRFRPTHWSGYREDDRERLRGMQVELTPDAAAGRQHLLVTKASPRTPMVDTLASALELPYLIGVPVMADGRMIALLVSGRLIESRPLFPPLDQGDLDTFLAIAGLLSAAVRNMRVGVLEELDRLKTEFFANISHEFRTPITLTLGPLEQLLSGRYGSVGVDAQEQLRMMQRNQERLLSLVNQILDLAKLEAGRTRLRAVRTIDLNRIVAELAAQFESAAEQRGLAFRTSLSPEVDGANLYLDVEKLERLIWNLLSNALKFTRTGFVEVSTHLGRNAVVLTVSDTGIGIRESELPHIFDRFRQADGSASREFAGTGIGLSLVKEIASLHGGEVHATSQYGKGTTFRVSLPLGHAHLDPSCVFETDADRESDGSPAPARTSLSIPTELAFTVEGGTDIGGADEAERANADAERAFDATRPTILYAEDNPDLRRHVTRLLRGTYNVFVAVDGQDGLDNVRRYRPDLVLSDHMMPRMTGKDLLRALRDDPELRTTPIIFLTARAGTDARIESLEAGADDYLTKPFNEGELLARVRNVLRARAQERTLADLNRRLEARVEDQLAELVRGGELQRFLPRSLVEQVMSGELGTGEEDAHFRREKITVLHVKVSGLIELTEQIEPEEFSAAMNELLRTLSGTAIECGGTVDKLSTEGITVLFGAPRSMPPVEQAEAAAQAALQMRAEILTLLTAWRRRGIAARAEMRAGIQTGFCTVGVFGSDVLRSYTAVGTPVAMASMLAEDAESGTIVCGPQTRALLMDSTSTRAISRGERVLRGLARSMETFALSPETEGEKASLPRLRDFSFMAR